MFVSFLFLSRKHNQIPICNNIDKGEDVIRDHLQARRRHENQCTDAFIADVIGAEELVGEIRNDMAPVYELTLKLKVRFSPEYIDFVIIPLVCNKDK